MKKPPYEKDALVTAIEKCEKNIGLFEEGIQKEMKYKRELQGYLREHEEYEKAKGTESASAQN